MVQKAGDSRRPSSIWRFRRYHPDFRHRLSKDVAMQWLRHIGQPSEAVKPPQPYAELIADFAIWMEHERGLSPATIKMWCDRAERFMQWYDTLGRPISAAKVTDVDSFLVAYCERTSRIATVAFGQALRAFFRHAEMRGWCAGGIANMIYLPRVFSHENIPSGPTWTDVGRLLAGTEGNDPLNIRDRAILLLFSVYGFRVGEVTHMCLDDIDWNRKSISLTRSKSRRSQIFPLAPTVGNALIRYLKEARPRYAYRQIFLTSYAPIRPIVKNSLSLMVKNRMARLGIVAAHHGAHSLRHACATRLLAEGFSIKEIADQLGHRSLFSTHVYAKVDVARLREVGNFDLGGML
jgi:site-specific recombinase XerD